MQGLQSTHIHSLTLHFIKFPRFVNLLDSFGDSSKDQVHFHHDSNKGCSFIELELQLMNLGQLHKQEKVPVLFLCLMGPTKNQSFLG